jgi:hypothetical protein
LRNFELFSFVFIQPTPCWFIIITCSENTKEERGSQNYCLSHRLGLRIAHLSRINNADAHANGYTNENTLYTKHERRTLSYHAIDSEVAKFKRSQIKGQFNVFPNMSVARPLSQMGFGRMTRQN